MLSKLLFFLLLIFTHVACAQNEVKNDENTYKLNSVLVDEIATGKTINLYNKLKEFSSKGFLYGHQDDLAYGIDWWNEEGRSDVKDVCGSYPAVFGWEIGDLGKERSLDSVKFTNIQKWIQKVDEIGGINTISWHMINPVTKSNSWDVTEAVYTILPGGSNHEFFKEHLQKFKEFNNLLIDKEGNAIPIVFRPFHEHNGSWFWWGKEHCTKKEYVQLWKFTVEYLKDSLNIHNLLYVYSPDGQFDDYTERYPGNEYVDILGFDYYFRDDVNKSIDIFTKKLIELTQIAQKNDKIAIVSETGYEAIKDPAWHTKAILEPIKNNKDKINIAYLLTWRNANKGHHYAPFIGHPSADDFRDFYKDPLSLFLEDIR